MEEYYVNQAGTGLPYFEGSRFQKGFGSFFGRFIKGGFIPMLKYIGRKVFDSGYNITKDVVMGESIKDSAKKNIKNTVGEIAGDIFDKVTQKGKGRKRKCRKYKRRKILQRAKSIKRIKTKKRKSLRKPSKKLKKFDFL
jgi:hypothetical protein